MNGSDDQKTRACVAVFVKGHQPHNAIMRYASVVVAIAVAVARSTILFSIY